MAALKSYVVDETDVEPVRPDGDTASVRTTFDAATGCELLEQRVIDFAPGRSGERGEEDRQEVLYVSSGAGALHLDGGAHGLGGRTGVYIAGAESYAIENPGPEPLRVVSVTAPDTG